MWAGKSGAHAMDKTAKGQLTGVYFSCFATLDVRVYKFSLRRMPSMECTYKLSWIDKIEPTEYVHKDSHSFATEKEHTGAWSSTEALVHSNIRT